MNMQVARSKNCITKNTCLQQNERSDIQKTAYTFFLLKLSEINIQNDKRKKC